MRMALSPFFTKLSASIPSIREKLARGEHAADRKDAEHQQPKPQPESRSISPNGPKADQTRYEEMLPS